MNPMDAIKQTYFQECEELLGDLERGLLSLQDGDGDNETINAVFRAVHSAKGGAGAFGFEALVAFSHVVETALDEMRSGRLDATPAGVASRTCNTPSRVPSYTSSLRRISSSASTERNAFCRS